MNIIAVIPAYNEADVIAQTINNLRGATPPPDSIIVIADACTDSTVEISEASRAMVFRCSEGSKGGALRRLFAQDLTGFQNPRGLVVIFDADSTVNPFFFSEVRAAFESGAQVTQSFVSPVIPSNPSAQTDAVSPTPLRYEALRETASVLTRSAMTAPTLAAYSEVLSQVFDDEVRLRLGWGVPLRGTGMAFRIELLRDLLSDVHTRTEDIELSLLLAQRGIRPKFLRDAIVYDPKPPDAAQVSRQRARWLQGQVQVWRSYWRTVLTVLWRGPEMWWLMSALLLKPKTLFVFFKFVAFVLAIILPVSPWLKLFFIFLFAAEIIYYCFGLLLVPPSDRWQYARALFGAPLYVLVWIKSLLLAIRSRAAWLSVRHK